MLSIFNLYIARKARFSREKGFSWGLMHRQKGAGNVLGEKKNLKMRVLKTCVNRYHTNSIGLAMVHNSLEKHTLLITNACLPLCTISSVFLKHGKNFAVYGA